MTMTATRRGIMLGAGVLAALPARLAFAGPAAVVAFHHDRPVLDRSGASPAWRPAPARAAVLPEAAYAWRPFL